MYILSKFNENLSEKLRKCFGICTLCKFKDNLNENLEKCFGVRIF